MKGITLTDMAYAGDFDTPEQEVGKFQPDRPWETCMTIAQQWSWKPNDQLKSLEVCLDILIKTAGKDGNLLLNVGPMPNGAIEERQVERLKEIGDWLNKYGESIYGTRGGPFKPDEWGVSTSKDNKIFLHVLKADAGELQLTPLDKKIAKCYLIDGGAQTFSQNNKGISISLSSLDKNAYDNIIVVELEH